MDWRWNGMGALERINGARIIVASFFENEPQSVNIGDEYNTQRIHIGYIDYIDDRWGKPRHRFAFIDINDFEKKISQTDEQNKKITESQILSIKVKLEQALIEDSKIDIVVERRQLGKEFYDYLVRVDNIQAFQG